MKATQRASPVGATGARILFSEGGVEAVLDLEGHPAGSYASGGVWS